MRLNQKPENFIKNTKVFELRNNRPKADIFRPTGKKITKL